MHLISALFACSLLLSVQAGIPETLAEYIAGAQSNKWPPHPDCKAMDPDNVPKHYICLFGEQRFHIATPEVVDQTVTQLKRKYLTSPQGGRIKATSVYLAKDFQVTGQSVFKEGVNYDALFWTIEYGPGCEMKEVDKSKWCLSILVKDGVTDERMKQVLTQQPTGEDGVDTLARKDVPKDAPALASTPEGQKLIQNTFGLGKEGTRQMTEEESKEVLEALTAEEEANSQAGQSGQGQQAQKP